MIDAFQYLIKNNFKLTLFLSIFAICLLILAVNFLFGLDRIPAHPPIPTKRNEPCPCGSGKKFKKCCGGASLS